jgi:hypothetical protein
MTTNKKTRTTMAMTKIVNGVTIPKGPSPKRPVVA